MIYIDMIKKRRNAMGHIYIKIYMKRFETAVFY